jgi:hypothetical protein
MGWRRWGGVRVSVIPGRLHARACGLEPRLGSTANAPAVLQRAHPMDHGIHARPPRRDGECELIDIIRPFFLFLVHCLCDVPWGDSGPGGVYQNAAFRTLICDHIAHDINVESFLFLIPEDITNNTR